MALCVTLVLTHSPFGVPYTVHNEEPSVCHVGMWCVCALTVRLGRTLAVEVSGLAGGRL